MKTLLPKPNLWFRFKTWIIVMGLFLTGCGVGSTIRLDYTFPMTIGVQVHFDAAAATQPGVVK